MMCDISNMVCCGMHRAPLTPVRKYLFYIILPLLPLLICGLQRFVRGGQRDDSVQQLPDIDTHSWAYTGLLMAGHVSGGSPLCVVCNTSKMRHPDGLPTVLAGHDIILTQSTNQLQRTHPLPPLLHTGAGG